MINKITFSVSRRLVSGVAALSIALLSTTPAALAEEIQNLDSLRTLAANARKSAEEAEKARAAAAESTRQQLTTLNARLDTAAAQNEILMEMMGQILATQAGASVEARVEAEVANAEAQMKQLENAAQDLAKDATTELEKALEDQAKQFEEIIKQVPNQEELKSWSKEEVDKTMEEIQKTKKAMDQVLDNFVEQELIPAISEACRGTTPYQQRAIVSAVRRGEGGKDFSDLLGQYACNEAPDLVRKLSRARSAEEVQDAFQSSMQNLAMAAMLTGNPYLALAMIILSALFSDGNGDGDGDGVDDQPGGGPIPGAPTPSTGDSGPVAQSQTPRIPTDNPGEEPSENPSDNSLKAPDNSAPGSIVETTNPDPRSDAEIKAVGGDPSVKAHPGVGCAYALVSDNDAILTLSPVKVSSNDLPFDLNIGAVTGSSLYADFPLDWKDPDIRLISCDFETPGVVVQFEGSNAPLCLEIARPAGKESEFAVTNTSFTPEPNQLCPGKK
ncbi:hypothetical protein HCG46_15130 [Labrenzia sp. PO1]|uniref:hypothetical protein n=1 Tax=Labrenzia sp. PO1 TaxID=2720390 RepID=UPI0014489AF2|nr:hypothetical protein [Labrenzia sp. PO1]NKI59606.1 hypothetical protein [Labrenzia sp. PO1]